MANVTLASRLVVADFVSWLILYHDVYSFVGHDVFIFGESLYLDVVCIYFWAVIVVVYVRLLV